MADMVLVTLDQILGFSFLDPVHIDTGVTIIITTIMITIGPQVQVLVLPHTPLIIRTNTLAALVAASAVDEAVAEAVSAVVVGRVAEAALAAVAALVADVPVAAALAVAVAAEDAKKISFFD